MSNRSTPAARTRARATSPAAPVDLASAVRDLDAVEADLRRAGRLSPRAEMALNAARWGLEELATLTAARGAGRTVREVAA